MAMIVRAAHVNFRIRHVLQIIALNHYSNDKDERNQESNDTWQT